MAKEKRFNSNQVMERLPQEIVSDVLSRLTAKDLMRCKCVCKFWFDLITDPYFVSNYYLFYNTRKEQLLVIQSPSYLFPDDSLDAEIEISILSLNLKGVVSSQVLNPPPYHNLELWGSIMGPCNGLYFLPRNPYVIMNPSLRQFITLPQPHFTAPHGTHFYCDYPNFGFDPKTNDYKVVLLKDHWLDEANEEDEAERVMGEWTVGLYSLNSNSWRNLGVNAIPFPFEEGEPTCYCTYVNNCCHWWGTVYKTPEDVDEHVVLSFDMVTELFRKIKAPQITHYSSRQWSIYLVAFTESATIGFIAYPERQGREIRFCFDVWMMKDYWDDGSWIKQYNIGPLPVIYKEFVGFYGSSSFLWKDANDRLVLYDPHREEQTRNILRVCRSFDLGVVRYMESLVSLPRGKQSNSHQRLLGADKSK